MYMSIQILKLEIQIRGMDKNNTSLILEEEMNSSEGWSVLSQKAAQVGGNKGQCCFWI